MPTEGPNAVAKTLAYILQSQEVVMAETLSKQVLKTQTSLCHIGIKQLFSIFFIKKIFHSSSPSVCHLQIIFLTASAQKMTPSPNITVLTKMRLHTAMDSWAWMWDGESETMFSSETRRGRTTLYLSSLFNLTHTIKSMNKWLNKPINLDFLWQLK